MTEDTPQNESIEDRLETAEDQLDELERDNVKQQISNIEQRLNNIETEQSQLREDVTEFVEALRKEQTEIPHIDSVQGLYQRLQSLEEDVGTLRELLEDVTDDPR